MSTRSFRIRGNFSTPQPATRRATGTQARQITASIAIRQAFISLSLCGAIARKTPITTPMLFT